MTTPYALLVGTRGSLVPEVFAELRALVESLRAVPGTPLVFSSAPDDWITTRLTIELPQDTTAEAIGALAARFAHLVGPRRLEVWFRLEPFRAGWVDAGEALHLRLGAAAVVDVPSAKPGSPMDWADSVDDGAHS